jgi:hypothetical protein
MKDYYYYIIPHTQLDGEVKEMPYQKRVTPHNGRLVWSNSNLLLTGNLYGYRIIERIVDCDGHCHLANTVAGCK